MTVNQTQIQIQEPGYRNRMSDQITGQDATGTAVRDQTTGDRTVDQQQMHVHLTEPEQIHLTQTAATGPGTDSRTR